jgi:hypothetical protein
LIGPKKVAGGIYLQNTRDELQNIEFNQSSAKALQKLCIELYQSPAKALHEAPYEALQKLYQKLYQTLCSTSAHLVYWPRSE